MKKKKGFTLVELLVVIAIIALLMSIMMPALAKVKKQAMSVVGMSNLKQWGTIMFSYATDNDGRFLTGWNRAMVGDVRVGDEALMDAIWILSLEGYYQDGNLRFCPAAKKLTGTGSAFTAWGELSAGTYNACQDGSQPSGSYGINGWIRSVPRKTDPLWVAKISKNKGIKAFWQSTTNLRQPNLVPLFCDSGWHNIQVSHLQPPVDAEGINTGGTNHWDGAHVLMRRHRSGINLVMGDNSVMSASPLNKLWTLKWYPDFDTDSYNLMDWTLPEREWLTK